jgi:outer membrane receptor protein involved in Fe transport
MDDAGVEPLPAELAAAPAAEGGEGLEEIVVTAQRRKTNLQETPISITAISGEDLRERGAVDLHGVAEATPNMQLTTSGNGSGGSSFAQVFIRGVGQADFIITKDPAVGIYVDGVYLARAPGALLELMDIERVEVLRGPQGTLFGKNTAGGAISVITKQPDGNFSGAAELRTGAYGQRDITGSFQAPLVEDRLFLRVSGMSLHRDGYYERLDPGNIDLYSSGYYIDIDNTEAVEQGPYGWLNARLAYKPESQKFELYAAVTNLTNRAVIGSGVSAPANGSQIVSYLPPRLIYGGARFNFD